MKGIIFNIFEDFIEDNFGEEKLDEIMNKRPLITKEPFVGPNTYPDEDLFTLVTNATEVLNVPMVDAIKLFGKYTFPQLAKKLPAFVEPFTHPKPFLLTVHDVIHVEVKKLFTEAEPPDFFYEDSAPNRLTIRYVSKRKLCYLMEGILDGLADHFKTSITYQPTSCAHDVGGVECTFELTFE